MNLFAIIAHRFPTSMAKKIFSFSFFFCSTGIIIPILILHSKGVYKCSWTLENLISKGCLDSLKLDKTA